MRVSLFPPGWALALYPVPSPSLVPRYDALLPGSVLLLLEAGGRVRAEAVWGPRRRGGRGGWLLLVDSGPWPPGAVPSRPFVVPEGRAATSLGAVLGRMAVAAGLSPGGAVFRSAMARFPRGDVRDLALSLQVMES